MAGDTIEVEVGTRYDSQNLITWWRQDALREATAVVVGAGAIGNEVIKNLALLGIGTLHIFDFDRIEASNLAKSVLFRADDEGRLKAEVAAERARQLNPDVTATGAACDIVYDLPLGLIADASIVLGCLDNRLARRALNELCLSAGTPWIDAGIDEMNGQVRLFGLGEGACYECLLRDADLADIARRFSCSLLARDKVLEGKIPATVTSAALVAAWQVQEAMKHVCGQKVDWGKALISYGLAMDTYVTALPRKPDCPYHEARVELAHVKVERDQTWAAILGEHPGTTIYLRHGVITAFTCVGCDAIRPALGVAGRVPESEARCAACGLESRVVTASQIGIDSGELLARTPAECGVPADDLLLASGPAGDVLMRFV